MAAAAAATPAPADPIVVDTNVVSYLFKGDTRGKRYRPHLDGRRPVVSFVTMAELDLWADLNRWGERRRARLQKFLATFYVHYPDRNLCRLWSAVSLAGRQSGRPILPADAWIAATAIQFAVPLLTHNPSDFSGVPTLSVISVPASP